MTPNDIAALYTRGKHMTTRVVVRDDRVAYEVTINGRTRVVRRNGGLWSAVGTDRWFRTELAALADLSEDYKP